jgi:hypothetical protein
MRKFSLLLAFAVITVVGLSAFECKMPDLGGTTTPPADTPPPPQ